MKRTLQKILTDERATSTAEWLLVVGVAIIVAYSTDLAVQTMISHIFTRTAVVIASPAG